MYRYYGKKNFFGLFNFFVNYHYWRLPIKMAEADKKILVWLQPKSLGSDRLRSGPVFEVDSSGKDP